MGTKRKKKEKPHPRENEPSAHGAQERTCWAEERRCNKGVDERNDEVAMLVTTTLQKRRSTYILYLIRRKRRKSPWTDDKLYKSRKDR